MRSRKAIMANTCQDYQRADKKGRGEILDRLVPVTGMNRDYLAAVPERYVKDAPVGECKPKGKRKAGAEGKRGGLRGVGSHHVCVIQTGRCRHSAQGGLNTSNKAV
ncbi:MAG: hypothetical protein LBF83_04910 [Spirochaetaceae bacterium]|nr:hypothetical protein [Spirochaetaceae bacterium]